MFYYLFFPLFLIFTLSKLLEIYFKENFLRCVFLSNVIILIYYYLILKLNFFSIGNFFFFFSILILFSYFSYKQKIFFETKKILLFLFTCLCIYFFSKDFYLYKYDEFSEYGTITKLIFHINTLPINDPSILGKGTYEKINLLSCFYIFFLKNSFLDYQENFVIFSHIFFIFSIIFYILSEFKSLNLLKKTLAFFVIIAFTYMLNSGLDRIYPETIMSLLGVLVLLLLNKINNKFDNKDFGILLLCLFIIFCIKQSGVIVSILLGMFVAINLLVVKKYKALLAIIILFLFSYFSLILHTIPMSTSVYTEKNEFSETNNRTFRNTYGTIVPALYHDKYITFSNLTSSIWLSNKKESIYHLYSFAWLKKILNLLKIDIAIPTLHVNFVFWVCFLLILNRLDDKSFFKKNYFYFLLIIFLMLLQQVAVTIWAYRNHLVREDGSLLVSWSRHAGILINSFFIFHFLNILLSNKNCKKIIYIVIIFIIIFLPTRSFRGLMPTSVENKITFWKNKSEQRRNIKQFSTEIQKIIPKKSHLLVLVNKEVDPYFVPILNYELIENNLVVIDSSFFKKTIKLQDPYYILIHKNFFDANKEQYNMAINIGSFKLVKIID